MGRPLSYNKQLFRGSQSTSQYLGEQADRSTVELCDDKRDQSLTVYPPYLRKDDGLFFIRVQGPKNEYVQ